MSQLIRGTVTFPNAICPQKAKIFLLNPCSQPTFVSTIGFSFLDEVEYDLNGLLPLTAGDLVLAFLFNGDPGNPPSTPTGWSPLPNSPVNSVATGFFTTMWGFYKILGSSETGIYNFDNGLAIDGWAANFIEYSGVDAANPINADVSGAANGNATPTLVLPSITTTHSNSLLLIATANQISSQPSVAGWTSRETGSFLYYFDLVQATAGASGNVNVVSFNEFGNGWDIGFLLALNPGCTSCQTVTYASILNSSSLVGGGAGSGASLTVDPTWTAEPATLTSQTLSQSGDRFQFKIRSGFQRGLFAGLYDGSTASNNFPDLWYGFAFDSFGEPNWWIEIGGVHVFDSPDPYTTDDQFEIRRNAANKAEFYRNESLVYTTPENIPANSKLNVWLFEEEAGVREVQFCTSALTGEVFTGLTVEPASGSNQGAFNYLVPGPGTYTFRAQLQSETGVIGGSFTASVDVI